MKRHTLLAASLFVAACLILFGKTLGSASDGKPQQSAIDRTSAVKRIALQAAGRGNPYINFEDGIELPASYEGAPEMLSLMKQNAAEPRALASADFDEDGVPDLICGYAHKDRGIITLRRGNVDSIYQNSPEAQRRKDSGTFTDSAFLSPARLFEAPIAADFVGAGDFDADGHWDVVIAARGVNELCLLPGDGKGGFVSARTIPIPGVAISLIAGEINRADGLADVIVGVATAEGSRVLVFEGPEGALEAKPEIFSLPSEPRALVLGQFDNEYTMDLAVGAGSELTMVHGRDRKLSLDESRKAEVIPAKVDRRKFAFEITSIAAGDFTGANETSLALLASDGTVHLISPQERVKDRSTDAKAAASGLQVVNTWRGATQLVCARVSTGPADDLLMLSEDRREVQILKTGLSGTQGAALSSSVRAATLLSLNSEPLAVLPMRLNADALSDLVVLQRGISGAAVVKTPALTTFTVVNTSDSGSGSLRQAIFDANANPGADLIAFNIPGSGVHTITAESALPTITDPVTIDGTTQPGFAGTPIVELIGNSSGPGSGVLGNGLTIAAGSTVVRGLVINRFDGNGIEINTNGGNVVEGNFLGTNASGTARFFNVDSGIGIVGASSNLIGGTVTAARNLISGNAGEGVVLGGPNNQIQGNFIGTDVTGTIALLNGSSGGIAFGSGASNNQIGGTVTGARNIISGNNSSGLFFTNASAATVVQGNFIGTDVSGTVRLSNAIDGLFSLGSSNNTIGGTVAGARNIISGNTRIGIFLALPEGSGNIIQGNFIGTDVTGTGSLANGNSGINGFGTSLNTIGGTTPGAGNLISGNGLDGISISGSGNTIQGNYIGTDVTGTKEIGNTLDGVALEGANLVGGPSEGSSNIIAFNGRAGVLVISGAGHVIRRNSTFSNGQLGIDLSPGLSGPTPNDACDGDIGSNNLQNYPQLASSASTSVSTRIEGVLNSNPGTTFTIEFFSNLGCDPSGFGEGQTFIGSSTVTTGADCLATLNVTLPIGVPVGQFITATATDPAGNTSEFSACVQVTCGYVVAPSSALFAMSGGAGSVNVFAGGTACAWFAGTQDSWITIVSADNGSGNGFVDFEVRENLTGSARQGIIKIADQVFTIVQDAGLGDDCDYSVSPIFQSFPAPGGAGSINVFGAERCAWEAVVDANWITLTGGSVGIGHGTVNYSVAANTGVSGRNGTITVAGHVFAVKQKGQ